MLDLKSQTRMLYAAAVAFVAVAGFGIVWALDSPVTETELIAETGARTEFGLAAADAPRTEVAQPVGNPILDLALQTSLYDPPPPPPKKREPVEPKTAPKATRPPPKKAKPKVDWTLTGTLLGLETPLAILTDAAGETVVKAGGDTIEVGTQSGILKRISAEKVTLEVDGTEVSLTLNRSFQTKAGGANSLKNGRRRNR
ncbi:MAG: hypothetical protein AAGJ83_06210 [Planctomycetota bacterium]